MTASTEAFLALQRLYRERMEAALTLPGFTQGSIPDMTASTEAFLALQRLYRERMEADAAAVEARAAALLRKLGRDPAPLRRGAVRQFVKNARNLRCGPQL